MKRLLLAACASLAMASGAQASVIPVLDTITPAGLNFEYSYAGTLAGDEGLVVGSRLVIFDFAGYVPGSISSGIYASDLAASTELVSALLPPPGQTDDPTLVNLVFTWTGAPFNASGGPFPDVTFAGLTAQSTLSTVTLGSFSAQAVINNGAATGQNDFNTGRLGVPSAQAVPEPATWTMLILGFGAVGALLRRRNRRLLAA